MDYINSKNQIQYSIDRSVTLIQRYLIIAHKQSSEGVWHKSLFLDCKQNCAVKQTLCRNHFVTTVNYQLIVWLICKEVDISLDTQPLHSSLLTFANITHSKISPSLSILGGLYPNTVSNPWFGIFDIFETQVCVWNNISISIILRFVDLDLHDYCYYHFKHFIEFRIQQIFK